MLVDLDWMTLWGSRQVSYDESSHPDLSANSVITVALSAIRYVIIDWESWLVWFGKKDEHKNILITLNYT